MWPPEVGRGKDWILPSSLEGVWPCRQLDFRVLVSRTESKYSSVVFSYYFVAFFFLYLPKEMKTLGLLKLDIFLKGPENYHINPKRCRHSIEGNPYIFFFPIGSETHRKLQNGMSSTNIF